VNKKLVVLCNVFTPTCNALGLSIGCRTKKHCILESYHFTCL